LRQLGQHLESYRYTLPQAARRTLGHEAQGLRRRSRTVLRRFVRHHQRKREQLLKQQLLMQRGFELKIMSHKIKIAEIETAGLRSENQQLRRLL
jgi:exodeoxyribonuclease VII large subunit